MNIALKKVLIICVNYNSFNSLERYITSIDNASKDVDIQLKVIVSDNSMSRNSLMPQSKFELCHVYTDANLGYLGAVTYAIEQCNIVLSDWDYFIISNVDLELEQSFFKRLIEAEYDSNVGWIAPAIISRSENKNRNPKIINRYTLKRLNLLAMMYKFPIIHYLYTLLLYKRQRTSVSNHTQIYAGHGSIMIFTHEFISKYDNIKYPCFLFGEEIFFAEELREHNLQTVYNSSIICYDDDHISTSKMKRRVYYKANYESLKYLISKYYRS